MGTARLACYRKWLGPGSAYMPEVMAKWLAPGHKKWPYGLSSGQKRWSHGMLLIPYGPRRPNMLDIVLTLKKQSSRSQLSTEFALYFQF